jgi:hypothetical protein
MWIWSINDRADQAEMIAMPCNRISLEKLVLDQRHLPYLDGFFLGFMNIAAWQNWKSSYE